MEPDKLKRYMALKARGCPGLMLDPLQPIPDAENLPFTHGNKASVCGAEGPMHRHRQ